MIKTFGNSLAERVWARERVRELDADLARRAYDKLVMLNSALAPLDLLQPPGNRCEKLGGTDRSSMRINGQWRDTFEWRDGHAHEVEIEDYHSVAPVVASPGRRGRVTFPSTTLENSQWP